MNDFQVFLLIKYLFYHLWHFLSGPSGKESICNAGDLGSIPGLGRSGGEGNGNHSSILAWRIPWNSSLRINISIKTTHIAWAKKTKPKCRCHLQHTHETVYSTPYLSSHTIWFFLHIFSTRHLYLIKRTHFWSISGSCYLCPSIIHINCRKHVCLLSTPLRDERRGFVC